MIGGHSHPLHIHSVHPIRAAVSGEHLKQFPSGFVTIGKVIVAAANRSGNSPMNVYFIDMRNEKVICASSKAGVQKVVLFYNARVDWKHTTFMEVHENVKPKETHESL
jgi:hypothetical protein